MSTSVRSVRATPGVNLRSGSSPPRASATKATSSARMTKALTTSVMRVLRVPAPENVDEKRPLNSAGEVAHQRQKQRPGLLQLPHEARQRDGVIRLRLHHGVAFHDGEQRRDDQHGREQQARPPDDHFLPAAHPSTINTASMKPMQMTAKPAAYIHAGGPTCSGN